MFHHLFLFCQYLFFITICVSLEFVFHNHFSFIKILVSLQIWFHHNYIVFTVCISSQIMFHHICVLSKLVYHQNVWFHKYVFHHILCFGRGIAAGRHKNTLIQKLSISSKWMSQGGGGSDKVDKAILFGVFLIAKFAKAFFSCPEQL